MLAITVVPGQKGSARLDEVDEPPESAGAVLVEGLALGICGTDLEIVGGEYGPLERRHRRHGRRQPPPLPAGRDGAGQR